MPRCSALPFSFCLFDFARSPTDAKPPDDCLAGVASWRASRHAPARVYNCGHLCRSCMPCKMSCTPHGSARLLVSAVSLASGPSRPLQHGHRLQLQVVLLVLRTRQKLLASTLGWVSQVHTSSVRFDGLCFSASGTKTKSKTRCA